MDLLVTISFQKFGSNICMVKWFKSEATQVSPLVACKIEYLHGENNLQQGTIPVS